MSIYKKTFSANAPAGGKPTGRPRAVKPPAAPPPPRTAQDDKRTFDARPKPSHDTRREERVRPSQHVDPAPLDPFDKPDGED